jgi:predicted dehydrogenase
MKAVTLIVVGAGNRGTGYASFALQHPDRAQVIGVAEPRQYYREHLASLHHIPEENMYTDWQALAQRERFADAVIIATQDALHVEPAITFARLGYHILLEKPIATNEADCYRIIEAAVENNVIFAVCHVMRYTAYTRQLKQMIDSGIIGEIVSMQHLEPVGYWHYAHSFVRGNWSREQASSFMLLAKSCHDLDWISYIMGTRCQAISSFGTRKHFHPGAKPAGAADRCVACQYNLECPYSATKIYLNRVAQGDIGWPVKILTPVVTFDSVEEALRNGPYGRCVYACDNDVVDNQVVNMLFEDGKTASFTMVGFTEYASRKTHIFGTKGELYGDGSSIRHIDFLRDTTNVINITTPNTSILQGHGGGDYGLMDRFISAIACNDPQQIGASPEEILNAYLLVFAAERARRESRVVNI